MHHSAPPGLLTSFGALSFKAFKPQALNAYPPRAIISEGFVGCSPLAMAERKLSRAALCQLLCGSGGIVSFLVGRTASRRIASRRTSPRRTASCRTASRRTASCRTASRRTASRRTASRRTASRRTSPQMQAALEKIDFVQSRPGYKVGCAWPLWVCTSALPAQVGERHDLQAACPEGLLPKPVSFKAGLVIKLDVLGRLRVAHLQSLPRLAGDMVSRQHARCFWKYCFFSCWPLPWGSPRLRVDRCFSTVSPSPAL